MALVPCVQCRQPFYASCHDASCIGAVCPYCEYAEILPEETYGDAASPTRYHLDVRSTASPRDAPLLHGLTLAALPCSDREARRKE